MAEIYLSKGLNNVLTPCNESDKEVLSKFGHKAIIKAEIKQPRNVAFHRKYFALLNIAYDNMPEHFEQYYPTFEIFRTVIQMKAGHFNSVLTSKGDTLYLPKSISFAKIDNLEFERIYEKVYSVILNQVLAGVDREELDDLIKDF